MPTQITGLFLRQVWKDDYAESVGEPIEFDAGAILTTRSALDVVSLLKAGDASIVCDCLFGQAVAWDGPFEVTICGALWTWLSGHGIDEGDTAAVLDHWESLRHLLADPEPAPSADPAPRKLSTIATDIYEGVLSAMQNAEEMGGPEGDDYLALMEAIAKEASLRADNFRTSRTEQ